MNPPETVNELIELLKLFNPDDPISFAPFTLYRLKDQSGELQFEFNEAMGSDYQMLDRDTGLPMKSQFDKPA